MGLPNEVRQRMRLRQDVVPPHYAIAIRNTLNEQFPELIVRVQQSVILPVLQSEIFGLQVGAFGGGYDGNNNKFRSSPFSKINPAFSRQLQWTSGALL
ncbi:hypothetical protein J6590_059226 [Homalodisca vitripennis]|nr:hypothetical protein J6590_059226 [Homalodisca vitripennis]